jgi:hypothetical protein
MAQAKAVHHREGSRAAKAHVLIRKLRAAKKPRVEVISALRKQFRIKPSTASNWYSGFGKSKPVIDKRAAS